MGTVGLFALGLLIGSTAIAALSDTSVDAAQSARFAANAATSDTTRPAELPSQPWSRIMGGRQFEKVTDVAITTANEVVFAGLSLGVGEEESSYAVLVRTGPQGFVHAQSRVSSPEIGSVSRISLDERGAARLVHWQGAAAAFASVDRAGNLVWSRTIPGSQGSVWADIASARNGETILAIASDDFVRIARLDASGKLLWRRDQPFDLSVETISLADSGDGGALIAIESAGESDNRRLELVRLNRRGQVAWSRAVFDGWNSRLADAVLDAEGSAILVSGAPSALLRYDGLGRLNWVRDLPALSQDGRHQLVRLSTGEIAILAEPLTSVNARRHWMARFDDDGRELWTQTRANRMNATFEAAEFLPNGMVLVGGSLVASVNGDTDMLMLALGRDGTFPSGYGVAPSDLPGLPEPSDPETGPSNSPMLVASAVIDGSMALQAAFAADRQAALARAENGAQRPQISSTPTPAPAETTIEVIVETVVAEAAPAMPEPEVREVSAPVVASAIAPARVEAGVEAAIVAEPEAVLALVEPPSIKPRIEARAETAAPAPRPQEGPPVRPQPARYQAQSSAAYAYQCTFTCMAQSDDLVRYPVTKIIANVSEENASLVSLDVMAMDSGVCLATGGLVYDDPRLPPVCDRMN